MTTRRALPARRDHRTQKVRIAGRRTLYLSTDHPTGPAEVWLRIKGPDCSAELIALYDVLARMMSLALQYGAPMETVAGMLLGVKVDPAGPVTGHDRIKCCDSLPDLIARHLLITCCGREDLAHVTVGHDKGGDDADR